jgi:hypothetical protein
MPCQITTSSVITSLNYPRFNKTRGKPRRLCCDDVDDDGSGGGANNCVNSENFENLGYNF